MLEAIQQKARQLVGGGPSETAAEAGVKTARERVDTAIARVASAADEFAEVGDDKTRRELKKAREAETDARDDLSRAERLLSKIVAARVEAERLRDEKELATLATELDRATKAAEAIVDAHAPALISAASTLTTQIHELAARLQMADRRHAELSAKLGSPPRFGSAIQPRIVIVPKVREALTLAGARHLVSWLAEL